MINLRVRDAAIVGFFMVFLFGRVEVVRQIIEPIYSILGFFSFFSIIAGRRFIKGPSGGFMTGIGLFLEVVLHNYILAS